jgi:hypothetical protein
MSRPRYADRKSKKVEYQERLQQNTVKENRPKKVQVDNPAAALVTQVPQGATKPVINQK